jgi:hypothetical protein
MRAENSRVLGSGRGFEREVQKYGNNGWGCGHKEGEMRRFPLLVIALAAWGMPSVRAVRADDTAGAPPPAIRLVLSPAPGARAGPLAPERLRAELAAELQRPIAVGEDANGSSGADVLTITWDPDRHTLTVGYQPAAGAPVTRTVEVAGSDAEVAALALLLAGNVARDQTAELLGPPRRRAAAPAPEPAPLAPPLPDRDVALVTIARGNVATDDAAPAPLLNRLRIQSVAWTATRSLFNAAVRASDRLTYAQLGLSAHREAGRAMVGPGLTVGVRIPLGRIACDSDIGVTYLNGVDELPTQTPSGYTNNRIVTRGRSALVFSPGFGIELFAGFGYTLTTHLYGAPANELGPELFGGVQL